MVSPPKVDPAPNGDLSFDRENIGSSPPARILIVDDDPSLRDLLTEALTFEGYRVVEAVDGDEALRVVSDPASSVRLMLLDVPRHEDSRRRIVQHAQAGGIAVPIVVVSGAHNADAWAKEIGAVAFLAKPWELEDLYNVVGKFAGPVH